MVERWSREEIEGVKAYPWDWEPTGETPKDEVAVIPGLSDEELRARGMEEADRAMDKQSAPDPLHITKADLERWGYTARCRRCALVRERRKGHGVRHIPECRRRIERLAREEDDPRVRRIDARNERFNERLA